MERNSEKKNGGGGKSRAAKKRAKQKNKKQKRDSAPADAETSEPSNSGVAEKMSKKAKTTAGSNGRQDRSKKSSSSQNKKPGSNKSKDSRTPSKSAEKAGQDGAGKDNGESSTGAPAAKPEVTFPNTPLIEILLLQETKTPEKQALLKQLTSRQRGECLLQAIIDPITLDEFYDEYWEKKPLVVKAEEQTRKRYDGLLSLRSIKAMSKKHDLYYARDLNVTRYQKTQDGVKRRVTLDHLPAVTDDEETQARGILVDPDEVWQNYDDGCTVRLLCPHKHVDPIHALLSTLELEFGCMVGANAYLTPPNASQGFAPHYDDIEAFCMQLEGKKRWKVYEPTLKLPRASSEDFTSDDVKQMTEVMDITLEPGDILYMPRGWIHQACTLKDVKQHSLHLTVSAMQQWAWADLMDIVIPEALDSASSNPSSSSLRQGMPRGFLEYMGAAYDDSVDPNVPESLKKLEYASPKGAEGNGKDGKGEDNDGSNDPTERGTEAMDYDDEDEKAAKAEREKLRKKFQEEAKKRIMRVAKAACDLVDAACDEMGKRFLSDRQPPSLTKAERDATIRAERIQQGEAEAEITPMTMCRLARPGIARLVLEDERAVVYHCADNVRVFHGNPLSPLEYEMDDGPALEQLLTTVEPAWIMVNDLIHDTIEDKVSIASSLYDEGILAIQSEADMREAEMSEAETREANMHGAEIQGAAE